MSASRFKVLMKGARGLNVGLKRELEDKGVKYEKIRITGEDYLEANLSQEEIFKTYHTWYYLFIKVRV